MSPRQLFEKLESLGEIDPRILSKIRKQIEDPKKTVKNKAILNYLIKKEQITKELARQLLEQDTTTPADATVVDEGQFAHDDEDDLLLIDPVEEVQPVEVVEPIAEVQPIEEVQPLEEVQHYEEVEPMAMGLDEPLAGDPIGDQWGGDSGFNQAGQSGEHQQKTSLGFIGKKDKKDQWATKWLYIGFGSLGFLLIMLALLFIANVGQNAEDQFEAAKNSFEKEAYQDAITKFDEYVERHPKHKDVPLAKALRVQSVLASSYTSKRWAETLSAADTLLPPMVEAEDSKLDKIRTDLAVMLPGSLVKITESAKGISDLSGLETELTTIKGYKKIVDNPAYFGTTDRKIPSVAENLANIENNIRTIEGHINKEKDYLAAITAIKGLGESGETDQAFAAYTQLTRNYGDLAEREALRETMLGISVKEMELVQATDVAIQAANAPRPTAIESTVVLATPNGKPIENLTGETINFLADGSVYGINAGDGTLVWRHFVGYQTTIQPQLLDANSLLVVDQKNHELLMLEKTDGQIRWRTTIGQPFLSPAVSETQIFVTTRSGAVIQINRQSGDSESSAQLPQSANVKALIGDRDPFIYQPGLYSNLYVLSAQDLTARSVFYLGHYKGSIAVPPQSWSGYVLVAINGGDYCDLHVFKAAKNGEVERVQVMTRVTNAPVTTPMQKFGRSMLLTADNGEIRILDLLPSEETTPVQSFASDRFDNSGGQPPFVLTDGSNMWIAGKGISRFRIKRSLGQFQRDEIIEHDDTFVAPPQKMDDKIFHVRRRIGSGMLSASMVDAKSLEPIWRTDFGGQPAGSPVLSDGAIVSVSNQGDVFRISAEDFSKTTASPISRASTVVEDLRFENLTQVSKSNFSVTGPAGKEDYLYVDATSGKSKLLRLFAPANLPACRPMALGGDLLIASLEGPVTRVDPATGRLVGTPFQPPIEPGSKTEWFEPTQLDENLVAIASGNGTDDLGNSVLYVLDVSNRKSFKEVASLAGEQPFKSRLVHEGNMILAVVEQPQQDQLVAIDNGDRLTIAQRTDLPGRVIGGPWKTEAGYLLKMDNDQIIRVGTDLTIKWSIAVPNVSFAGNPETAGSQIMLTFQDGKIVILDSASGERVNEFDLGQPIVHAPVHEGQRMFFSGLDGTVHSVDLSKAGGQ